MVSILHDGLRRTWLRLPGASKNPAAVDLSSLLLTAGLLGASFWIFDLPEWVRRFTPRGWAAPTVSTIALLAGLGLLCAAWRIPAERPPAPHRPWRDVAAGAILLAGIWALCTTLSAWMDRLVVIGLDPARSDMLLQIQAAIERLSTGQDPYFTYHVPHQVPLSYGPWLWMWYLIPIALRADMRLVTVFGEMVVPALLTTAAASEVRTGRYLRSAVFGILAWVVLRNPLFDLFITIGHTPAYWLLIVLFALASAGKHRRTAAIALGALLGARTTMVALVPVFFIWLWRNDRKAVVPSALLALATVAISFGPFVLWDWRTLFFGMYSNYVQVIRDLVWPTAGITTTLGLTRFLVAAGHERYVGLSQVVVMAGVYGLVWWRLRPGQSAGPWMCLALTAFCMTTLWPVWYVFLDVFVLGLSYLAADYSGELRRVPWRTVSVTAALALCATCLTLAINPGIYYTLEPGRTPRWHLRSGFGPDERDGDRGFAWALRDIVHVRLPRGLWTDAGVTIECDPDLPPGAPPQKIGVRLNDTTLGQVTLHPGWQTVTFRAPGRVWRIGHNDMALFFAYVSPSAFGEPRAARIGRIRVTP